MNIKHFRNYSLGNNMNINIILTKFVEIINSTLIKNIVDLSSTFNFNIPIKTTCKEHCIKFKKC